MKLASEIINLDVFGIQDKAVLGVVREIIIDPTNGAFVAISIYGKGISKKRNIISSLDIQHIDSEILIVESSATLGAEKDLPKAYGIKKEKIRILGNKVVTEKGDYLGRVADFALETSMAQLSRIYVSRNKISAIIGKQRIFSYDQIKEIQRKKIVVFEDKERAKDRAVAEANI